MIGGPCNCPEGKPCDCEPAPAGINADFSTPVDIRSGGTGNTLDRFRAERTLPGGLVDWGSLPGWLGFSRPVQNLNRQWDRIDADPEFVGFHQHRVYADPAGQGQVVSLMGDPRLGASLYPDIGDDAMPHCGYEFRAGRI